MRANSRLLEQLQELGQEKEQLIQELQEARKVGNTEGVAQTAGAQVKEEPLTQLLREVVKYNLWFLEEGTLDIENWDPVGENLKTAHRRGDCIHVMVFVTWGLVRLVPYPIQTEK